MTDRFDSLLDDATAGLRDDPELRLDVRAELASHLEATAAAYEVEGHPEEESHDLAAQDFGSPAEVAGELLSANKRRMTVRALVRLLLRAVVVPAAVLVAIFVGYRGVVEIRGIAAWIGGLGDEPPIPVPALPEVPGCPSFDVRVRQMTNRPIFHNERFYAYWQQHPEKTAVFTQAVVADFRGHITEEEEARRYVAIGRRIDPDNGLYQFALAEAYLQGTAGTDLQRPRGAYSPDESPVKSLRLHIRDRAQFDQAMRELLKATTYLTITSHQRAFLREQLAQLPPGRHLDEQIMRIGIMASLLMPEYARMREFARMLPLYAQLLNREGQRTEALRYLAAWKPYARQILRGAESMIGLSVADGIIQQGGSGVADVYDEMGLHAEARRTRAAVAAATAPHQEWLARVKRVRIPSAGLFDALLPSGRESVTQPGEFRALRRLEQVMLERWILLMFMTGLGLVLWMTAVPALYWTARLRRQRVPAPLLLLDGPALARIAGWGIALPLALSFTALRLPWQYDITWGIFRLALGLLAICCVTWAAVILLPYFLAREEIRRRCRALGVPEWSERTHPREKAESGWRDLAVAVACGWPPAAWLLVHGYRGFAALWEHILLGDDPVAMSFAILTLAWGVALAWLIFRSRTANRYTQYLAIYYRSMLPVMALVLLVMGGIVHPLLQRTETYYLGCDTLVFTQGRTVPMITPVETRLTEQQRGAMLAGLGE
jgi:hypothetical protein